MRLWDTHDIASYLGITRHYAAALCRTGQVAAIKVGQEWRTNKRMVDSSLGIESEQGTWRSNEK